MFYLTIVSKSTNYALKLSFCILKRKKQPKTWEFIIIFLKLSDQHQFIAEAINTGNCWIKLEMDTKQVLNIK